MRNSVLRIAQVTLLTVVLVFGTLQHHPFKEGLCYAH